MNIREKLATKERPSCRPNIVPILDAVFIFIFFLLMSAEFIKFYVIHSDSPAVKMVQSIGSSDKTPLNLAVEVEKDRIIVKSGPQGVTRNILLLKNGEHDLEKLLEIVIDLKKKNIDENSIILRPHEKLAYKTLIKLIDLVRKLPPGSPTIVAQDRQGKTVQTSILFDRIIFEKNS